MALHSNSKGWTLNQGLAAQYAVQAGLDPELAANAGDKVWDVLRSLRNTIDEPDPRRRVKRAAKTRRLLAKAELQEFFWPELKTMWKDRFQKRLDGSPLYNLLQKRDDESSVYGAESGTHHGPPLNQNVNEKVASGLRGKIGKSFPDAELDGGILNPNVEHTPEYQSERLLYNQGTADEKAQRALDAATQVYGDPSSFKSLGAITKAVNKSWTPTGITAGDIAGLPPKK